MTAESPFVTLEDVAKYFVVSASTVRTWVRNGTIPKETYIKIGYAYRFKLPEVEAALIKTPKVPVQLELDLGDKE
jgi:excisionase family DNA binding protein